MARSEFTEYLRSRRALVTSDQVGLPSTGVRRVPGLRREEVAILAGVSADYYGRLEQGRECNPSAQVLDAVADALRLGTDERLHLFHVAGTSPRPRGGSVRTGVDPGLVRLMEAWSDNPAHVYNRAYDVLASNAIADALFEGRGSSRNLMHWVFLEPAGRIFFEDWADVAAWAVASFRLNHGAAQDDPRIRQVLAELVEGSAEFRRLWARHDARGRCEEAKTFRHRDVGDLLLQVQALGVKAAPGQELVIYHAEPGSGSARGLALLGSLAATRASTGSDGARPAARSSAAR